MQIKNVSQKIEKPVVEENEKLITSSIKNFEELINLCESKKEIELKFDLERNVKLVKYSEGKIDIEFNEKLSKDFIKNLTSKLYEWTKIRWIITLSKGIGDQTIYEKKIETKKRLMEEAKKSEVYKKVLDAFPDAELIDTSKINSEKGE